MEAQVRFQALWGSVQPALTAYAIGLVGPVAADDLVQEAALTCWVRFAHFDAGRGGFLPWALGVTRNHALHAWRARARRREELGAIPELLAQAVEDEAPAMPTRGDALRRCLDDLPLSAQGILTTVYGGDLDQARAAERLGLSHGALRVRLSRLRAILRRCIEERLGGAMDDGATGIGRGDPPPALSRGHDLGAAAAWRAVPEVDHGR